MWLGAGRRGAFLPSLPDTPIGPDAVDPLPGSSRHIEGAQATGTECMVVRRRSARALAPLLFALFLLCASGPPGALGARSAYVPTPLECQVLTLINAYRAAHGLAPLVLSETLGEAARAHSMELVEAQAGTLSHTLPDGSSWADNIRAHGYAYNTWLGENLAAGYRSPARTVEQWQHSPLHDANLLEPDFEAIGVGLEADPDAPWRYYWTTTFGGYVDEPVSCAAVDDQ
jgi:uncharacterized protein YkwD